MLKAENLSIKYGDKTALYNTTLSFDKGELVALIGTNGSGKSTLLKALAGQLLPNKGMTLLNNQDIGNFSDKERAKLLSYFPQNRPLPNMDVWTLVSHGRFPHMGFNKKLGHHDLELVKQAIQYTNLENMQTRMLSTLSGGERQRAYLAMMIAQDSDILLLDEASSFLDVSYQLEIMDIMCRLNRQGKTILFASHDLQSAFSIAKRVVVLKDGAVAGDASPNVLANSQVVFDTFGIGIRQAIEHDCFKYVLTKK